MRKRTIPCSRSGARPFWDRTRRQSDPGRYVETTEVPYLTLSLRRTFRGIGLGLGDLATVIHTRTGRIAHAILGDDRPVPGVQPSLCLSEALGLIPRDDAIYLIHPRSGLGQGTIPSNDQIQAMGDRLFRLQPSGSAGTWEAILADCFREVLGSWSALRV